MANYESAGRTNYFQVTDPEKLKELVDKIDDAELWEKGGMYAFGAYADITQYYSEETDDYEETAPEIQKLLPENEVCILMETGYEKLRYVSGFATIVTKDAISIVNLEEEAKKKARELLGLEDKEIEMIY